MVLGIAVLINLLNKIVNINIINIFGPWMYHTIIQLHLQYNRYNQVGINNYPVITKCILSATLHVALLWKITSVTKFQLSRVKSMSQGLRYNGKPLYVKI